VYLNFQVNKVGRERYSAPYFYEPNFDTVVECLPSFCSSSNPPKHAPTTSGEYLVAKYLKTHKNWQPDQDKA
jgi:isopenicillin N synthase-like dioxygenase